MFKNITFIDLFAGIGGFHIAFDTLGASCVFASEIDIYARKTYRENFKNKSPHLFRNKEALFNKDITQQDIDKIPEFNVLCAGFPCQPFSNAGLKKGFEDTRGTLFFDIANIISKRQPEAFFLENVRGLKNHENGKTFEVIKRVIEDDLGYSFYYKIVKASDYGLPQSRPRLFMIGFKDKNVGFEFPEPKPLKYTMSYVMGGKVDRDIGYTLRCGGRGSGVGDRRNWDCYIVDGVEQRMNSIQGKRMQGFPDSFIFPVSETQAMKQLGNSVAVDAIKAVGYNVLKALRKPAMFKKEIKQELLFKT